LHLCLNPVKLKKAVKKNAIPPDVLEFFRKHGEKGGKLSGEARMAKLTPEQRSEIARKAAAKSAEVRSKKAAAKKRSRKMAAKP
jgi:hypothetical protein